jgi:hypothetical protein
MPIVQNAAVFTACAHDQADRPTVLTTANANSDSDAPPPDGKTKGKRRSDNGSRIDTAFAEGYRAAYTTIYDRNDYAAAIEQLKALRHDDSAVVANLIGQGHRWQYCGGYTHDPEYGQDARSNRGHRKKRRGGKSYLPRQPARTPASRESRSHLAR